MKILHLGKTGNVDKYAPEDSYLRTLEVVDMPIGQPVETYLEAAGDADFIIADAIAKVPAGLINGMPNLKSIHSEGVAFNGIDVEAAHAKGVIVCHSVAMNASAVAEQTVLLMLGVLRDVIAGDRAVREGKQIQKKEGYIVNGNLLELADLTVGLIGMGSIAESTVKLLRAFGVQRIVYNKRHLLSTEREQELGIEGATLPELLAQSDMVSLHVPVTPQTQGMANDKFFAQMRDGSFLVNTSRGELVDDAALVRALESGKLAMAGLDTIDHEPVQPDHPLLNLQPEIAARILFSPHIGGITRSSFKRSFTMIGEDMRMVAEGGVPERSVQL